MPYVLNASVISSWHSVKLLVGDGIGVGSTVGVDVGIRRVVIGVFPFVNSAAAQTIQATAITVVTTIAAITIREGFRLLVVTFTP